MPDSTSVPWPSLYNWVIEVYPIQGKAAVQPGGVYLYDSHEIFRFTLYWTLVFYVPAYVLCAIYAFLNVTFPPRPATHTRPRYRLSSSFAFSPYFRVPPAAAADIPLMAPGQHSSPNPGTDPTLALVYQYRALWKPNETRSRVTLALLVFLAFVVFSVAGAVVGSAVIGYVLAGLFKAGDFNMSTWIPFLGGLLQSLVGLLGLWPSVVDII
ncbi:hypothetical protein POSPLADRAFT_1045215 [Postia placenta MAD-698-R-SB12]|uniref:Integral membrane protein n=1 Tax=Postia placenta MAD-698-R-SB12 TaxID=670580 RepID=A0A1X6N666_9APHY|nr:hypothetical protein POSPLADRAFT_1045215 [Postia placenta MAD-698-R-SB12]OSX64095.1 hypothetical protein POSPLADRAFT_1045215 [Postia placenta MAD-698-R-SB12]